MRTWSGAGVSVLVFTRGAVFEMDWWKSWDACIHQSKGFPRRGIHIINLIIVINSKRLSNVINRLGITWISCKQHVCMPGLKPKHGLQLWFPL